jgi:cation/acetate symporter
VNDHESLGFRLEKARIDAGFGFGLAAFAAGLGLLALLDRIGLPDRLLRLFVLALTISGFLATAAIRRTTRTAYFYAAGRVLSASYCGLATAALAAGLFMCLLQLVVKDARLSSLALGFGLGLFCAVFGTGYLLRRSAAVSLADLIAARFPHLSVRFIVAIIAATCAALIAWAGYDLALRGLISATGMGRASAASVVGAILCFLVIAGGLSTVLWVAVEAMIILLFGLALPLLFDLMNAKPLALPLIGDPALWEAARMRLITLLGETHTDHVSTLTLVLALAAGLAALAPLLGPIVASGGERAFARTGLVAFGWLAFLGILGCATMAASTLALDKTLVGHAPADLPAPIYAANADGLVTICGGAATNPAALAKDCASQRGYAGTLRPADIRVLPDFLLETLTKLRQFGPVLGGLADSFLVGIGLTLAAAGIQSFVTSLSHDAIAPGRRRRTSASLRLALARALAIVSIAALGILLTFKAADTGVAITLALFISAAFLTPIVALLLSPRADSLDASVTFFVTLLLMANLMLAHGPFAVPFELAPCVLLAGLGGLLAGLFSSLQRGKTAKSVGVSPQTVADIRDGTPKS